jgi:hypothetical protein
MFMSYEKHQTPLTPLGEIKFILDDVVYLVEKGALSEDQGTALAGLLESGIRHLNKNDVQAAIIRFRGFIGEVNTQIKRGIVPKPEGTGLIDAVNDIIVMLPAGGKDL